MMGAAVALVAVYFTNKGNLDRLKVQHSLDHEATKRQIKREKLEDLYLLVREWSKAADGFFSDVGAAMEGKKQLKDASKKLVEQYKDDKSNKIDLARIEMIVHVYLPQVRESFNALEDSRDELGRLLNVFEERVKSGNKEGIDLFPEFMQNLKRFENLSKQVLNSISKTARDLDG